MKHNTSPFKWHHYLPELTHYLYACVQRAAREQLEGRGALRPAEEHRNGVAWSSWAEEPAAAGDA